VSENFGAEILNSLISAENMLKERRTLNFVPMKFKELPADKH
jgi:hypothetical protein